MNPRAIKNFFTSKFGLFLVFVAVLFSGLLVYGRSQAEQKEATRLASAKKAELGKVQLPLNDGLENGLPQQAGTRDKTDGGKGDAWRVLRIVDEAIDIAAYTKDATRLIEHRIRSLVKHQLGQLLVEFNTLG